MDAHAADGPDRYVLYRLDEIGKRLDAGSAKMGEIKESLERQLKDSHEKNGARVAVLRNELHAVTKRLSDVSERLERHRADMVGAGEDGDRGRVSALEQQVGSNTARLWQLAVTAIGSGGVGYLLSGLL